jgi:hypothetical protein
MARKFLYLVAFLIVVAVGAALAWSAWEREINRVVFVPRVKFEPQPALAGNAYADPKMWFSRPGAGANDPARWLPEGWTEDGDGWNAAVFFIHPTSYLARDHWNAALDDAESQNRARLFLRGMASPFNKALELWAPRYRQAAFGAFLTDAPEAAQAREAAYADVEQAFAAFIAAQPKDRPLILAGHSQGALHLTRLLHDHVAGTPLAGRIVAAYAIGWPISLEHDLPLLGLPACAAREQAGCLVGWSSFAEPAEPADLMDNYAVSTGFDGQPRATSEILCSNPLTGGIGGEAPASANLGTLVPSADLKSGRIETGLVPARCEDGLLLIGPPPQMGPYVLPGNNFHVYDIPLFWANLRGDAAARMRAWQDAWRRQR